MNFQGHGLFITLAFTIRIIEALGNAAFLTASFAIIAKEFPNNVGTTFVSNNFMFEAPSVFINTNDLYVGISGNILWAWSDCGTYGRWCFVRSRWLLPTVRCAGVIAVYISIANHVCFTQTYAGRSGR